MRASDFLKDLESVARHCVEILRNDHDSRFSFQMKEVVRRVSPLEYRYEARAHARKYELVDREYRLLSDPAGLQNVIAMATPAQENARKFLTTQYALTEQEASAQIQEFISRVAHDLLSGREVDPFHRAVEFKDRVEGVPRRVGVTSWVSGVRLPTDLTAVELSDGVTLRQPTADDLTWEHEVQHSHGFESPWWNVDSILEVWVRAIDAGVAQQDQERALDALRLLGLGSASVFRTKFWEGGDSSGTLYPREEPAPFTYTLERGDAARFQRLLTEAGLMMREQSTFVLPTKINAIGIALQRYRDALCKSMPDEGRIALAISAIEALLLRGAERSELKHRLAQRAAVLVARTGKSSLRAYDDLSRAYEIRSSYVHGSPLEVSQRTEAAELSRHVLEYARIVIANMMLAGKLAPKDDIIGRLDRSLLDTTSARRLEEFLPAPFV